MMPPESLLEELNHKEPAGISQTKGMEVGGGGAEREAEKERVKRQRKWKAKRSKGKKECGTFNKLQRVPSG